MGSYFIAVGAATVAWFIGAAVLFFNPVVDKIYRSEEDDPAVRNLPQGPKTIGMILTAVIVQCLLWAGLYTVVEPALGDGVAGKALAFAALIAIVKVIPRDIDRLLLTTYPKKRMTIELVNGLLLALPVGFAFAYLL